MNIKILFYDDNEIIDIYGVNRCLEILNKNKFNAYKLNINDIDKLNNENTDVLIIPGGEPKQIRYLLKGHGSNIIRKFISNGGGYIGICAGAVLAVPKSPSLDLLFNIKMVNDNIWWNSGICGDVELKSCENINNKFNNIIDIINKTKIFKYFNGPLFKIKNKSNLISLAKFNSTIYKSNINNNMNNEIINSISIVYGKYNKGSVLISSIHPEYNNNLLIEMCLIVKN